MISGAPTLALSLLTALALADSAEAVGFSRLTGWPTGLRSNDPTKGPVKKLPQPADPFTPFSWSTAAIAGSSIPAYPDYICNGPSDQSWPPGVAPLAPKCAPLWPFAISRTDFDQHLDPASSVYQDDWTAFDSGEDPVADQPDGIPEIVLTLSMSNQGGCPGNSGALSIAPTNPGLPGFVEQLADGVTQAQVETESAANGHAVPFLPVIQPYSWPAPPEAPSQFSAALFAPIALGGNPGLAVGQPLSNTLDAQIGDIVAIFIHDGCTAQGSSAAYQITELRFVILVDYSLHGSTKWLKFQPCRHPVGPLLPFAYRWGDWYVQADPNTPPVHDDWSANGDQVPDGIPEVWLKTIDSSPDPCFYFATLNIEGAPGLPFLLEQIRYGVALSQLQETIGYDALASLGTDCGWIADDLVTQAPGPGDPPSPDGLHVVSPSANFLDQSSPVIPGQSRLDIGEGPDEGFHDIANVLGPTELEMASPLTSTQPHLWYRIRPGVAIEPPILISGNPGISGGLASPLESRIGDVIALLLRDECDAQGFNHVYHITCIKYAKLLYVKLTGNPTQKRIVVQPVPPPDLP